MRHTFDTEAIDPLAVLPSVNPALPAGPQIFDALKAAILNMVFVPGQALSEPEIGAALGVSRTPVREAFARLRAIDLVTTLPSRGSYVTKLNEAKIREAQYLREALELANVQHLANRGLHGEIEIALRQNLDKQTQAVTGHATVDFHALDDAFHFLLAEATGFPRAAVVLSHEKAQLDRLRMLSLHRDAHFETLLEDHRRLVDAIQSQDGQAAQAIAKPHFRSILTVLHDLALDHADFFDKPDV